jgi:hypothetical protein
LATLREGMIVGNTSEGMIVGNTSEGMIVGNTSEGMIVGNTTRRHDSWQHYAKATDENDLLQICIELYFKLVKKNCGL